VKPVVKPVSFTFSKTAALHEAMPAPLPTTPPKDELAPNELLFWTVEDVAKRLQVSVAKVYEMDMLGQLPSFKLGGLRRFRPATVEAWAQEIEAKGGLPVATEAAMSRARTAMRRKSKAAHQ
jgi:excisionase family DNA binding protein